MQWKKGIERKVITDILSPGIKNPAEARFCDSVIWVLSYFAILYLSVYRVLTQVFRRSAAISGWVTAGV